MFDFVSTRAESTLATRREAQLLAFVLATRVRDAHTQPTSQERKEERNLNAVARSAIVYLFDPDSAFSHHIDLIGGNAETFRAALLGQHQLSGVGGFTDAHRGVIQLRHQWWRAELLNQKETS